MNVYDIIDAKKKGKVLSAEEIAFFVRSVADKSASDAQIAAFCMAVLLRGMEREECFLLTDAMAKSGEISPRPACGGVFADKHSTGGVSDSTTLVLVPVLASLGVRCAKYSGRGLGHTGGTLDKLESFPGLNVSLTARQFARQAERVGGVIAGQTVHTVPADKRMYAVRDVTATVDSIPLIASSVMSKKLASFADIILLDVKYGDGAFLRTAEEAEQLARLMGQIGTRAGRRMIACVTCMDAPLGDCIGCDLEVREVIQVLKGKQNALSELSLLHAAAILAAAENIPREKAQECVREAVASGRALDKFAQIVSAQGGDARPVYDETLLPLAPCKTVLSADREGTLAVSALALGKACVALGGGRSRAGEAIDHTVGIRLLRRAGETVRAGEPIAEVYSRTEGEEGIGIAAGAFSCRGDYSLPPLVHCVIEKF